MNKKDIDKMLDDSLCFYSRRTQELASSDACPEDAQHLVDEICKLTFDVMDNLRQAILELADD